MKIYTSYFSKIKELKENNIVPISIALYNPKWYDGLSYKKLAPTDNILFVYKKIHNVVTYCNRYRIDILNKLNVLDVIKDLMQLSNNNDVALICYEKPLTFCHRQIVAAWFRLQGIDCSEWK